MMNLRSPLIKVHWQTSMVKIIDKMTYMSGAAALA
jgi:hypothetical protein